MITAVIKAAVINMEVRNEKISINIGIAIIARHQVRAKKAAKKESSRNEGKKHCRGASKKQRDNRKKLKGMIAQCLLAEFIL